MASKSIFANTNWYDFIFKDHNLSTDYNFCFSGGNDNASCYVSGGYFKSKQMIAHVINVKDLSTLKPLAEFNMPPSQNRRQLNPYAFKGLIF